MGSGEHRAAADASPKMTDWWADFGIGERGLIRPSAAAEKRVETSGLFSLKELTEGVKSWPRPAAHVETEKTPYVPMIPPPVLPVEAALAASDRSVWAIPGILGAMVLVGLLSALGTLWITGRAGQNDFTPLTAGPGLSPGRLGVSRAVVPPARLPSARNRGVPSSATPGTPPRAGPATAAVLAPPVELRETKRERRRHKKRSRRSKDRDADEADVDKSALAAPGYSLYAALNAVGSKPAPAVGPAAAQQSGGVAPEAVLPPHANARPSETYHMLKVAAGGESPKPAARSALPARLPASAVTQALGRGRHAVQQCLHRFGFGHATIRLRATVSGATGRVTAVRAQGRFVGTPVGRCAERRVRRLRFARFAATSQTVLLPIRTR